MDLSYQKTGTLLRQNVVFSEDGSPLNNFTTDSLQNDASVKSESTSTSDIYSDSFKTENKPDETGSSTKQNQRMEIIDSAATEQITSKTPLVSDSHIEPDETSVNQFKTDDNGIDNKTPSNETVLQTSTEAQETETPLNISDLFGFASQARCESKEDKSTETQTPEEPPQDPSGNNLIQSADDGFSQIDFNVFDADNSTDDHIETDTKEDDSQICATPLYEPSGSIVQDDSLFNPAEPSAQEEPIFEPIEHIVSEEPVSEQTEHTSQEKTFFEPIGQAVPKTKPATSVSEIDPMFGAAPSFDIESIKASFDAKKTGSKKKPKKGLFNRKK